MGVFLLIVIAGYLLGSIPSGLLISKKVANLDITTAGSGNIGAANVAREVGFKWGIMTLLFDMLKGFIPVALAHYLLGSSTETHEALKGMIGLACLLGHRFSVYNRLKGGKGVATTLGAFLAISPVSCLFSGITFFIVVSLWRYVSVGSIVAALTMPLWLCIMGHSDLLILISSIMSLLITLFHRDNLRRLIRGKETRW